MTTLTHLNLTNLPSKKENALAATPAEWKNQHNHFFVKSVEIQNCCGYMQVQNNLGITFEIGDILDDYIIICFIADDKPSIPHALVVSLCCTSLPTLVPRVETVNETAKKWLGRESEIKAVLASHIYAMDVRIEQYMQSLPY